MNRLRKLVLAGGLGLLLAALGLTASVAMSALAQPPGFAHQFYGSVKVCSTAVGEGEEVSARIDGVVVQTTNADASGNYGYAPNTFKVYGQAGDTIEFYVLDKKAGESPFLATAIPVLTNLDLVVEEVDLTVGSTEGGSVTVPGEGVFPYDCSTVVPITATPEDECWEFTGWTGDVGTADNVAAADTTITMNGFYRITANFAKIQYTLTVEANPPEGGTVTGSDTYDCSTDQPITATAAAGYAFVNWTGEDIASPTSANTTVHIDGNKTATANFEAECEVTYDLTVASIGPGSVTVPGQGVFTYCEGEVVDLLAVVVPDACSQFVNWTGDVADSDSPTTTVTMDGDKAVTANFATAEYDLTVDSTAGGSVTSPGEGVFTYDCGEVVALVAEADPDYKFVSWTGDVADSDSPTTTVTMDGDKAVTANFTLDTAYDLTVDSTPGGSVTNPGEGTFEYESETVVDLVAEAEPGGIFINWTGEVDSIADVYDATTTITMDDDYEITACFSMLQIELEADWNTFSTPIALAPCADTWGELLASSGIEDDVEVVYYYDSSTQYWGVVSTGVHDQVKPLEGFFVKLKDDSLGGAIPIIAHPESPVPPSKELYTGANLIGSAPASLEDEDVVSNLTTIYYAEGELLPPGYSLVISPPVNLDGWSVYYRVFPEPGTSDEEMQIGRAYWVIMENPDTLWGTSTTPLP